MENEIIELENAFIVLAAPVNTVELTISAKVYIDGKLQDVYRKMDMKELQAAFKEAEDGYSPSDAVFSLTPLGKKVADELIKKQKGLFEEG